MWLYKAAADVDLSLSNIVCVKIMYYGSQNNTTEWYRGSRLNNNQFYSWNSFLCALYCFVIYYFATVHVTNIMYIDHL